jgi:hypothetical protein
MMNHLLASVNIEREGRGIKDVIKETTAEIHLIAIDSDLFFTPEQHYNNGVKARKALLSFLLNHLEKEGYFHLHQ